MKRRKGHAVREPTPGLEEIAEALGGYFRQSLSSRCCHLVIPTVAPQASVTFFPASQLYRVFWPYPGGHVEQRKKSFTRPDEVVAFLSKFLTPETLQKLTDIGLEVR